MTADSLPIAGTSARETKPKVGAFLGKESYNFRPVNIKRFLVSWEKIVSIVL